MALWMVFVGMACVGAAAMHGYLGETRVIGPAVFESRQAKRLVSGIWQFSTAAWMTSGFVIAASPWLFTRERLLLAVSLACLPVLYGIVMNAVVTRGRHFGWKLFSAIVLAAIVGASILSGVQ